MMQRYYHYSRSLNISILQRQTKLISQTYPRQFSTLTDYQLKRIELWDQESRRQKLQQSNTKGTIPEINITLKHQNQVFKYNGIANECTTIDILRSIHEEGGLKSQIFASQVNGNEIINLNDPLQESCDLELIEFSTDEGKHIFWHSSAHVLGQALEEKFGDAVKLSDGPALVEGGFFYEMILEDGRTISESDFQDLQKRIKKIVKAKQEFQKLEVTREFAMELFAYSHVKQELLNKIPEHETITLYRCGPFIDLCRGPHVPHTGMLNSFEITRCGASHGETKFSSSSLYQRVYGISFPNKADLSNWKRLQQEAKKRDHRVVGKAQHLFLFHPSSPGSCFFLPHGTRIFNKLADFIRKEYKLRGYDEVITPQLFKHEVWATSGHLKNYHEDMFMVTQGINTNTHACGGTEEKNAENQPEEFGLKPMNCPGHCLLFKDSRSYSYRDLPVRFADFSALHRNEASGALTGLTRVRRFHQDDAHIFCRSDQVMSEILSCLQFIQHVYGVFGFKFKLQLATRPEKYMGDLSQWESAEQQLITALDSFGETWTIKPGDGAFYGPKIDISVTDALLRQHQCGTIQLDFQLPKNFELSYDGSDGAEHTPIIIHRAVLGSLERMMAILIEHTGGKWPLWLSPRQIAVLPVAEAHHSYAKKVKEVLTGTSDESDTDLGLYVDVFDDNKTLSKRIRRAQVEQYNYICVVGDDEMQSNTISVRYRDAVGGRLTTSNSDLNTPANENASKESKPTVAQYTSKSIHEFLSHVRKQIKEFK